VNLENKFIIYFEFSMFIRNFAAINTN